MPTQPVINTDLSEKRYIETELEKATQGRFIALALLTVVLFLVFMVFDYYISPAVMIMFLPHRIIISCIILGLAILSKRNPTLRYQQILTIIAVVSEATTIEIISLSFNAHQYMYYNGMILVIIGALGFLPMGWRMAGGVIAIVYFILLVPVSLYSPLSLHDHQFIMVNAYLLSAALLAFIWRISHQELFVNWLKQQYRLGTTINTQAITIEKNELVLSALMDASLDCIIFVNSDKKIMNYNVSATHVFHPKIGQPIAEMYQLINSSPVLYLNTSQDYEISAVINGIPRIFIVVVTETQVHDEVIIELSHHDVTEQRNLQTHLMHIEKINAINTFICGTMHDVKNLFSTILLFTEWFSYKTSSSNCIVCESARRKVSQIEQEVHITKLSLTRLISTDYEFDEKWEVQDINLIISEAVSLFTSTRLSIVISLNLFHDPCLVYCNKNLISNAMVNLIINATDAMQNIGTITIITDIYDNCCRILIKDTGVGIPDDILPYLFDPFFTTKHHQGGTGLGLHIVKNIIQQHKGSINVLSKPGDTVFTIALPISVSRNIKC